MTGKGTTIFVNTQKSGNFAVGNSLYMSTNTPPCLSQPHLYGENPTPWDIQNRALCSLLLRQRIEERSQAIYGLLADTQHNWEEAFYISLARSFGFHTNSRPMELLARHTPLAYLNKHRDSLFQLTALLLGQAGLLTGEDTPQEEQSLYKEYTFLQKKFSLTTIDTTLWRRAGVAPDVRIRQLALLLHQTEFLFSQLMEEKDIEKMVTLLSPPASAQDTVPNLSMPQPVGRGSVEKVLLNVVFPYQYAYHRYRNQTEQAEQALSFYEKLPAESNGIIRQWQQAGQIVLTAADSQALLQLTATQCTPKQCAQCLL